MSPKQTNTPEPIAYSVEDAARAIGLGRTKLFELIRTGQITAVKVGGRTLVPVDGLRRFLIRKMAVQSNAG
jgi:excisionase family DNA binding protein